MTEPHELTRLAHAINILRPEWPVASILTQLRTHHAHRPVRDLAVALTWIAVDPATRTPARLREHGPWWDATATNTRTATPLPPRTLPCHHDGHTGTDMDCRDCDAMPPPDPDEIARIRAEMRNR